MNPDQFPENLVTALERSSKERAELFLLAFNDGLLDNAIDLYLNDAGVEAWTNFLKNVEELDFDLAQIHREELVGTTPKRPRKAELAPIRLADCRRASGADYQAGKDAVAKGKAAALVFAGGAATRFFAERDKIREVFKAKPFMGGADAQAEDDPKSVYPVSPVSGKSYIFRIVEEAMQAAAICGRAPYVLFMTSPSNDASLNRHLDAVAAQTGFDRELLVTFPQNMLPRLDNDGCLVAEADGSLVKTGDGHGGVYRALLGAQKGKLEAFKGKTLRDRLTAAGVEFVVMGNVDNVYYKPFDLKRIGLHANSGAYFTTTMVARRDEREKVGVPVVDVGRSRVKIIEYNEIPAELADARDKEGALLFDCAHINTNVASLSRITDDFPHTVYRGKKIKLSSGQEIETSSIEWLNHYLAQRFEKENVCVMGAPREAYFMPTKNVLGEDSLQTTLAGLLKDQALLLSRCGAEIKFNENGAPLANVEISPLVGTDPAELAGRGVGKGWKLGAGATIYLGVPYAAEGFATPYSDGLELEEGASLIVHATRPLGDIKNGPDGKLEQNLEVAGRVHIGANVKILKGVTVKIILGEKGSYVLPANTVVDKDLIVRE